VCDHGHFTPKTGISGNHFIHGKEDGFLLSLKCVCTLGFYDDINSGTFGTVKKGVKRPLSNFNFAFKQKIVASVASSTGYLVEVIPEVER
jgi:hypothetical protein